MFHLMDWFRQADASKEEIVSLGLHAPDGRSAQTIPKLGNNPAAAVEEPEGVIGARAAQKVALDEIGRRAKELLSVGKFPGTYFYVVDPCRGHIMALPGHPKIQKPVVLFSSALSARDYLRGRQGTWGVAGFNLRYLPLHAKRWSAAGIDGLSVLQCKNPTEHNIIPLKNGQMTNEVLAQAWAFSWAIRCFRGELFIRQFFAKKQENAVAKNLATLKLLRDRVDYCNPYVHWLIALMIGMQGDEEERLTATERLKEFGPEFAEKDTRSGNDVEPKKWMDAIAMAHVGLLASFGMLPQQQVDPTAEGKNGEQTGPSEAQL